MSVINVVVTGETTINVSVSDDPPARVITAAEQGPEGIQGPSGTLEIGTVETLPPGEEVTIENVGTPQAAILNIAIPKGDTGDPFSNVDGGRADSVYGGIEPIDGGTP